MRPHGTRAKYNADKCRCELCRKANNDYEKARLRVARELADALALQATGTVRRVKAIPLRGAPKGTMVRREMAVRRACPGFDGKPCAKKTYCRGKTNLCSYCRGHLLSSYTKLPVNKTRIAIERLRRRGMGLRTIALLAEVSRTRLMKIASGRAKLVAPETQAAILDLLAHSAEPKRQETCCECDLSHEKPERLSRLRRMLPCTLREVLEAYPCVYRPDPSQIHTSQSPMKLYRDMRALRARSTKGLWAVPEFKNPPPPRHKKEEETNPL